MTLIIKERILAERLADGGSIYCKCNYELFKETAIFHDGEYMCFLCYERDKLSLNPMVQNNT